jgi:3-phenylpropionate/cinnamic acid dioxygenase small subunit
VGVTPAPGELLSSWLHRLALANGVPPRYFGRVLGLSGADWSERLDRALPKHVLDSLVDRAEVPAAEISGLALGPDPLTRLRLRLKIKPQKIPTSAPRITRLQYCPTCLMEDQAPYFRRGWTLATRVSCLHHGRRLRDRCPHCSGGIAPSRQDQLLPQHICVWCGCDLRKRTVRVAHDVQQLERLIEDLLRLHVAGYSLPEKSTLPALLSTACFTFGTEHKSIAQLPLRDRHHLFCQLAEGSMRNHLRPDHRATAFWMRLAQVAPKHTGLTKTLSKMLIIRTTARRDIRTVRKRVEQILTGVHYAEEPLSRIAHLITNVQIRSTVPEIENASEIRTSCRFHVYQNRVEHEHYSFVGRRYDTLVRVNRALKIRERKIILDQNVLLAKCLTAFF